MELAEFKILPGHRMCFIIRKLSAAAWISIMVNLTVRNIRNIWKILKNSNQLEELNQHLAGINILIQRLSSWSLLSLPPEWRAEPVLMFLVNLPSRPTARTTWTKQRDSQLTVNITANISSWYGIPFIYHLTNYMYHLQEWQNACNKWLKSRFVLKFDWL